MAKAIEDDKLMRVMFFQQPGEANYFTPCPNGKAWQIERGKEVIVPKSILHVADLAVMTVFEQVEGSGEMITRDIPRAPYIVYGEA